MDLQSAQFNYVSLNLNLNLTPNSLSNSIHPIQTPPILNMAKTCYRPTTLVIIPNESVRLFLLILYSLTALFALTGNLVVLVVQVAGKETAKNIRKYLINLAISDLLVGVLCMPITYYSFIHRQWYGLNVCS